MQTKKITSEDISDISVSALPTRPASDNIYSGEGYSSAELKAAFDRLPLYIIEAFNSLLDDIKASGENSISGEMPTGIEEAHSLYNLFEEIKNGTFANRILIDGVPLPIYLARMEAQFHR